MCCTIWDGYTVLYNMGWLYYVLYNMGWLYYVLYNMGWLYYVLYDMGWLYYLLYMGWLYYVLCNMEWLYYGLYNMVWLYYVLYMGWLYYVLCNMEWLYYGLIWDGCTLCCIISGRYAYSLQPTESSVTEMAADMHIDTESAVQILYMVHSSVMYTKQNDKRSHIHMLHNTLAYLM